MQGSKIKTKHWKSYRGNGVALMCRNTMIAYNPYRGTNFSITCCPICSMEVTTIGHSPDTDEIQEYARV